MTSDATFDGIQGFDHVQVTAPRGSEERIRAFYGATLGLPELPKPAVLAGRGGGGGPRGGPAVAHRGGEEAHPPPQDPPPLFLGHPWGPPRPPRAAARAPARG